MFSGRSQEVTLSTSTDSFFQAHHLATFGDLGTHLKTYVQMYQSKSQAHAPSNIQSIGDMKRFVEEYPEFRKLGGNVSKHVAIVGELSRLVERDRLLTVGEVEQGLASGGQGADLKTIQDLIMDPTIAPFNKLKLVCLYALRHQKSQAANNIASLIELALKNGVDREDAKVRGSHSGCGLFCSLDYIARIRIDEHRRIRPTSGRSLLD